ncbi:MAG TPA: sigma-70 family RNA polymerase sigma factor [Candidatus Krumholzibacteria bacterium]|nr:sigma-70 family RNA polymerase sigma factor [Candidatus Krumholzibacteria bacterium]
MAKTRAESGQQNDPARDTALLRRIRGRDEAALSEFYDRYSSFVYSLARSVLRDDGDAEDIVQEVFFRVWERADAFDPARGSPAAWLTTMTRRLAIDRTRSRSFRARGREAPLEAVAGSASGAGGESVTNSAEANEVLAALEQLEPAYREVIRLSYYEGLSHSNIATKLGTPLGTVKSRLREGVTQLRRILAIKA